MVYLNTLVTRATDTLENGALHLQSRATNRPGGLTLTMIVLQYIPNKVGAGIMGVVFEILAAILFWHIFRHKNKWGLVLPIGSATMGLGFFLRVALASNEDSTGVYALQQLFIVCSPAAFLAFNYVLYGRFVTSCVGTRNSLIKPSRVAPVFVVSDVVTFLMQASGGAMAIKEDLVSIGNTIFLIGLIAQLVSYALCTLLIVHTHWKAKNDTSFTGQEAWWKILWCLHITSVLILIRCVYRAIEQAQGHGGYLLVHEVFFYVLDVIPLFIVVLIYTIYWPARYIGEPSGISYAQTPASSYNMTDKLYGGNQRNAV